MGVFGINGSHKCSQKHTSQQAKTRLHKVDVCTTKVQCPLIKCSRRMHVPVLGSRLLDYINDLCSVEQLLLQENRQDELLDLRNTERQLRKNKLLLLGECNNRKAVKVQALRDLSSPAVGGSP